MLSKIGGRQPYSAGMSSDFAILDKWSRTYLKSSAYETLKSRGLDLISDSALRQQIVNLFEVNYVHLANDHDRAEWINLEVSMVPLMLKHLEENADGTVVPIDYESLLDDQGFRVAVKRTLMLRQSGIRRFEESSKATTRVIDSISRVTGL